MERNNMSSCAGICERYLTTAVSTAKLAVAINIYLCALLIKQPFP